MTVMFGAALVGEATDFSPQRPSLSQNAGAMHQCRACGTTVATLVFFDTRRQVYCRPECWEEMDERSVSAPCLA